MSDFSELEDQLRKLRPAQPSADLMTRIESALSEEPSTPTAGVLPRESRFHFNWFSLGLGLAAAAAFLLLAFLRLQQPTTKTATVASSNPAIPTKSNAQFVPAGLTQVVYHTRDEGLHFPTNSTEPVRRVRAQTHETFVWRNPKTGASLQISYPSEQVSLIPVNGQ